MDKSVFAFFFLFLLGLANALWGSTVGIWIFINEYYNLEQGSLRSSMINGVFYAVYLILMPFCFCVKSISASIIAITSILIGLLIRLFYYVPDTNSDNFISYIKGIDAVIIGNILIAIAQPFIFNFIIETSEKFVSFNRRGLFIGATSMFTTLGYSVGYLISIYTITSKDEYALYFKNLNIGYFIFAIILSVILVVFLISKYRDDNANNANNSNNAQALPLEEFNQVVIQSFSDTNSHIIAQKSTENQKSSRKLMICICIIVYSTQSGITNGVFNHLENILIINGFNHSEIFILSFMNLMPGLLFPLFVGYIADKTRAYFKIAGIILFLSTTSQILFFYSGTSYTLAFTGLLSNGFVYPCIGSIFLTLISELQRLNADYTPYNNIAFSASTLVTVIILLIPIGDNDYPYLFGVSTALVILSCLLYLITFTLRSES